MNAATSSGDLETRRACVRAYAKTPHGPGGILVRMGERRSDICLVRGGADITRQIIPIGRAHFVNDVAWCLRIEREHAAELVRRHGILPRQDRRGTLALVAGRGRAGRDAKGSTSACPESFTPRQSEARAIEFAGYIGKCIATAVTRLSTGKPTAKSGRDDQGDGCRSHA